MAFCSFIAKYAVGSHANRGGLVPRDITIVPDLGNRFGHFADVPILAYWAEILFDLVFAFCKAGFRARVNFGRATGVAEDVH